MFPGERYAITRWFQIRVFISIIPLFFKFKQLDFTRPRTLIRVLISIYRYGFTTCGQIDRSSHRFPDRVFLVDDYGQITYAEAAASARRIAAGMRDAHGLVAGDAVAMLARNGRNMILPLASTGYTGMLPVLLNVSAGPDSIARSCAEIGVRVIVTDEEFVDALIDRGVNEQIDLVVADPDLSAERRAELAKHPRVTFLGDLEGRGAGLDTTFRRRPKQIGIVIMSSGTTSDPKGVHLPVPATPLPGATIVDRIPWRVGMTVSFQASMFHAWGWANINIAAGTFGTIVTRRLFDAAAVLDAAEKWEIDAMISSPVFYQQLLIEDSRLPRRIDGLEFLVSSGNAVPPALAEAVRERFGPVLYSFYGSTEHTQIAVATAEDLRRNPYTIGYPLPYTRVAILDENGRVLPNGETGTIYAANGMSMHRFVTKGASIERANGMFSTGDLGSMSADGEVTLFGRGDSMIINGGENIHLQAVENCIYSMPGVFQVHIDADRTDPINTTPVAWVVRDDSEEGRALTEERVKAYVRSAMLVFAVPSRVSFLDELPRNDAGKVVPRRLVPPVPSVGDDD